MTFRMDPRAKLYLLLLANLMLLFHVGTGAEAAATTLCLLLFFLSSKARAARLQGGLLSHLHFQYASGPEHLFDPDTHALRSPLWYATMCDGDGTLLEQCNIVRALHRLPVWEELPEL